MSSSTSDAKKQLFTLEGAHNYLAWHTAMKAFLQMTGSWTYADNDVAQPADADLVPAWQTARDKCLGTIVIYCSGLIQQSITNEANPHVVWTTLQTTYSTPGTAGIYVEFHKAVRMQIKENEDPNPHIQEMQSVFSYLANNGLTLPDSARAMILLLALPPKWEGFASTILATLPVVAAAAGAPALTFAAVLPKIQEEWSRRSNSSVMPKKHKEEKHVNAQAGPSKRPICQKCKKPGHTTGEHRDDYKPSFTPASSQPKKKFRGNKKKDYKGKGKVNQRNDTIQVISIAEQDSDGESTGCASHTAEAGWSVLTSDQLVSSSECPLRAERLRKKKELDDDYARRQALCAPMYDPYNDDDNYGYKHFTLYQSSITKCQTCPQVSQNHKEAFCPQHKNLYGLWLLDSGATDHSTPFMDDSKSYKSQSKYAQQAKNAFSLQV